MVTKIEEFGELIETTVNKNLDKCGAVYTDEIMDQTNLTRETITRWLKENGFAKSGSHTSRRWVNESRACNG